MFNTTKRGRMARSLTLALVASALAGCGDDSATPTVLDLIAQRTHAVTRAAVPYTSVLEAMPNVVYLVNGTDELRISDAYATSSVVAVDAGRSFYWKEDPDSSTRVEVPFNDDEAQVSTLHLTVAVERAIVAPGQPEIANSTISVGLVLNAPLDLDAARKELTGNGSVVVLLLVRSSLVFDYDPTVWAILDDGEFFGLVSSNGTVSFPALAERELVPDGLTIEQFETPTIDGPISISNVNGQWVRVDFRTSVAGREPRAMTGDPTPRQSPQV